MMLASQIRSCGVDSSETFPCLPSGFPLSPYSGKTPTYLESKDLMVLSQCFNCEGELIGGVRLQFGVSLWFLVQCWHISRWRRNWWKGLLVWEMAYLEVLFLRNRGNKRLLSRLHHSSLASSRVETDNFKGCWMNEWGVRMPDERWCTTLKPVAHISISVAFLECMIKMFHHGHQASDHLPRFFLGSSDGCWH